MKVDYNKYKYIGKNLVDTNSGNRLPVELNEQEETQAIQAFQTAHDDLTLLFAKSTL